MLVQTGDLVGYTPFEPLVISLSCNAQTAYLLILHSLADDLLEQLDVPALLSVDLSDVFKVRLDEFQPAVLDKVGDLELVFLLSQL